MVSGHAVVHGGSSCSQNETIAMGDGEKVIQDNRPLLENLNLS